LLAAFSQRQATRAASGMGINSGRYFTFTEKTVQLRVYFWLLPCQLPLFVFSKVLEHMVTIRLARGGAKKRPFYNIVVTDKRKPRDSGYIERLGFFNPVARGKEVRLQFDQERVQYWLSQGAQPSERVGKLLKDTGTGSNEHETAATVQAAA